LRAEYPGLVGGYSLVPRDREASADARPGHRHPGAGPGDFGTARAASHRLASICPVRVPYRQAGPRQLVGGETAECLLTGLPGV